MTLAATGAALGASGATSPSANSTPDAPPDVSCGKVGAHRGIVKGLAFTPDGTTLISACDLGEIKLWTHDVGGFLGAFNQTVNGLTAMALSPKGKWVIAGGFDGKTYVFSMKNRRLRKSFKLHYSYISGAAVLPGDKYALTQDTSGYIKLWILKKGKLVLAWKSSAFYAHSMAVSPNGRYSATGGSGTIELFSLQPDKLGELLEKLSGLDGAANSLKFSPDSKYLAKSCMSKNKVQIYGVPNLGLFKNFDAEEAGVGIRDVAFSPDGKMLATASTDRIRIWSFPGLALQQTIQAVFEQGATTGIYVLAFNKDNTTLAAGFAGRTGVDPYREYPIRLFDSNAGKLVRCLMDPSATRTNKAGVTYSYQAENGKWVQVTVPDCSCAAPMPDGAVCVCDTVAGGNCGCVGHACSCVGDSHYWFPN